MPLTNSRIPADILNRMLESRAVLEIEEGRLRGDVANIEAEKAIKIDEVKRAFEAQVAEINLLYAETVALYAEERKGVQNEITNLTRALAALGHDGFKKPAPAKRNDEITPEAIYDYVVNALYRNRSGLSLVQIGEMLHGRGYIDPDKNRQSATGGIIGGMIRAGLIAKHNNVYVLADEQEAEQRQRVRSFLLKTLQGSDGMTTDELQRKAVAAGLMSQDGSRRRVRGILMGMSRGQHIERVPDSDVERFRVAA